MTYIPADKVEALALKADLAQERQYREGVVNDLRKAEECIAKIWRAIKVACYGACPCSAAERDSGHRIDCWYPAYREAADKIDAALADEGKERKE